jgi:diguanylate cyclase (GGDEF)-like protein
VTVLMLDLDYFKSTNDRFGHAIGDEVLRVFANMVRTSMRASDIIGRLGGEEFAVMLPEPMEFASRIAECLRAAFEQAGVNIGGHAIGATLSIGAAMPCNPVTDINALMARADAALYRAKHDGRNRLYAAEDQPAPKQGGRSLTVRGGLAAEPPRLVSAKAHAGRANSWA